MDFKDIKLITKARYNINLEWEYFSNWAFRNRGENFITDLSPDYQRDHVWTIEQKSKYIEWILKGGMTGKDIYFNCPGWMSTYKGPLELVDGKQRVSAVLEFLDNKVKAFGYYLNEITYQGNINRLPTECYFDIYISNLSSRKEILQWYIDMNSGGTVHTSEEIARVNKMLEEV